MPLKRHFNQGVPPYKLNEYTSCGLFIFDRSHLPQCFPGNPGVVPPKRTTRFWPSVTCQKCKKNRKRYLRKGEWLYGSKEKE